MVGGDAIKNTDFVGHRKAANYKYGEQLMFLLQAVITA
jgi:hypothetical protein